MTNRHVALPVAEGKEKIPETFTFHMRRAENERVVWDPISLDRAELLKRIRVHKDSSVDVCAVSVLDLLTKKLKSGENFLQWYGVANENLPGKNKIRPEVTSDAVVVGYPRGFYDEVNLYPIVKSGIVASRWGAAFGGKPFFLIDAKLFPGSSGSVVISKPTNVVVEDGNIFHNPEKQFAFLGVFSGEPFQQHQPIEMDDMTIIRKAGFNVGIVWYAELVEEIIGESGAGIQT